MVKNTSGGNKHKSMARKDANGGGGGKIYLPQEEGECFAKVTKMLGNGMCMVSLMDGDQIINDVICHIRGKFRARNKRQNTVSPDSFLIVGLRSWSSDTNKCDLIHVFDNSLISSLLLQSHSFHSFHNSFNPSLSQDNLLFSHSQHDHDTQHHHLDLDHHLDHHLDLDLDLL